MSCTGDQSDVIYPKIQFTVEKEKDDQLSFLDVCVNKEGGRLLTAVYRKPTYT